MKRIKFKQEMYDCPESWDDCTLGQIVNAGLIDELIPNAPIVSVISGYVGIPTQDILAARARDLKSILSSLEFIETDYQPKSKHEFSFNGNKYSCVSDITELRFDQWVSAQTVMYNYRDTPIRGLPKILASLCLMSGETIDQVDLDKRGEELLELPYTLAKDIEGFFLDSQIEYEALSQLSSIIKEQELLIPKQLTEVLNIIKQRKAHPSTSWPMKRVIGIYQNYLRSFQQSWDKHYNSLPIED